MPRLQICISLALKKNAPSKKYKVPKLRAHYKLCESRENTIWIFEGAREDKQLILWLIHINQEWPQVDMAYKQIVFQSSLPEIHCVHWIHRPQREKEDILCRHESNIYNNWPQTRPQTKSPFQIINITETTFFEHTIILDIGDKKKKT